MSPWLYFALPMLFVLVVLQSTFVSYLQVLGITVQIVPAFVIAWSLLRERGSADTVAFAFFAGLLVDLLSISPMGLTSLSLMIAVLALFPIQSNIQASQLLLPVIMAGVAMFTFLLVNIVVLRLSGYAIAWQTVSTLPQNVVLHALFILPVYWAVTFINRLLGYQRLLDI